MRPVSVVLKNTAVWFRLRRRMVGPALHSTNRSMAPSTHLPLPAMNVFLTGATGFVGQYVARSLLSAGHHVRALVRSLPTGAMDPGRADSGKHLEWVEGDILRPSSLHGKADGMDAVVHLVGIIEEKPSKGVTFNAIHRVGTQNVVVEAKRAGVRSFIQMSANGAREDGVSAYQTSKWKAENSVLRAGFEHAVVLRPSLIFGKPSPGQPEFCSQLVRTLLRPFPVWPVFGDGSYLMQPVHVEDVAEACTDALVQPKLNGKRLCLGGPEAFAYTEILKRIAEGAGIGKRPMIKQPAALMSPVISLLGGWALPITSDQFRMLLEGNECPGNALESVFNMHPRPFDSETLAYLQEA
ncbi:MAG: NAD-dependent epimerase [Bacteroidetes bacterium CG12_big_fil_rev_8_21_14_0_65_60_17]|nr:MAG: NAD-dependent epimerase [Bacteroidetes bacterium CG12_big_fil_rev_8_21_14_0_65_60_17]